MLIDTSRPDVDVVSGTVSGTALNPDVDAVQDHAPDHAQDHAPDVVSGANTGRAPSTGHMTEVDRVKAIPCYPLTAPLISQIVGDLQARFDVIAQGANPDDVKDKRRANAEAKDESDAIGRWMRFWIEESSEFRGKPITPQASHSKLYFTRVEHLAFTAYHEVSPWFVVAIKFELMNGKFSVVATLRHVRDGNGFASLNWKAVRDGVDLMQFHESTPLDVIASHARYQAICLHVKLLLKAGLPHAQALEIAAVTWPLDKE